MTAKKKLGIGLAVVLVLGVMAVQAVRGGGESAAEVRAEEVRARDLVARVSATGHVEARRSVEISSDISGRVVRLTVEEGDRVERDQLLLQIDPSQYEAAERRAEAALAEAEAREAQARASFEQARRDYERIQALREAGRDFVTVAEVETARTEMEVQQALWRAAREAVRQAEAALNEARDRLSKTTIRSPMAGLVTRVNVEEGETAVVGTMNNPGSLLLTVADLSQMEAVVYVDETDIPAVSLGDSASVEIDAFPDRRLVGRVVKIGNSSVQPRVTSATGPRQDEAVDFEVRVALDDPPPGIRPDLSATADIITALREEVPAIPIIALTLRSAEQVREAGIPLPEADSLLGLARDRDVEGVFLIRGDTVVFRPVRVGIAGDSYFEALSGVAAGDTVVAGPYQAIRELEHGRGVEIESMERAPAQADTATGGDTAASTDTTEAPE